MTFLLDEVLERVRTELKDSLTDSVIKQLLDDLNDEKVLGDEEVESILQQNPLQADRARCLIGSVKKKGPKACQILLEKLQKRDKYDRLGLELGIATESAEMGQILKFVKYGYIMCKSRLWQI
uniref:CARD domain-containing protein n=1 Tax=Electrophorus electricus TaxID=8005 RepID=A0AAY5EGN0_ELEEL